MLFFIHFFLLSPISYNTLPAISSCLKMYPNHDSLLFCIICMSFVLYLSFCIIVMSFVLSLCLLYCLYLFCVVFICFVLSLPLLNYLKKTFLLHRIFQKITICYFLNPASSCQSSITPQVKCFYTFSPLLFTVHIFFFYKLRNYCI